MGCVTLGTALFVKFLRFHVGTGPGSTQVKFEVPSFNQFGAFSIRSAAHRQTDAHQRKTSSLPSLSFTRRR